MISHLEKGKRAENLALKFLKKHDYELMQKNYSCKLGEIDLIMHFKNTIVFIEVRYRSNINYGSPIESINRKKQKTLSQAAEYFLLTNKNAKYFEEYRFDVIGINHNVKINWIKNAFTLQ